MRHTVIPDVEQFKQYYLRGQQGRSIVGFAVHKFKDIMVLGILSKVLHAFQFLW